MRPTIAIVTSIHRDYDPRIWKHALSLVEHGCRVHLICPWVVQPGYSVPNLVVHPFKRVQKRSARAVLIPARLLPVLWSVLAKVDLVHFHDLDLLPWMALISIRKPVVYDIHENYPDEMLTRYWIPNYLRRPLYHAVKIGQNFFSRIIRHVVVVAPSQLQDLPVSKLHVVEVRNYVSLSLLNWAAVPYSRRPKAVVFTGAHYMENGSFLILDIVEELNARGYTVPFIVTDRAEQPVRAALDRAIIDKGLAGQIRFLKSVPADRVNEILDHGAIGIAPNLPVLKQVKAIPTKVFEYMAAGMPVVASDLPYLREFVGGVEAGFLAEPGNAVSFADAIIALLENDRVASEMGRNGMSGVRAAFNWEGQIPGLLDFYQKILMK